MILTPLVLAAMSTRPTSNRRTFITTLGSIAAATIAATAGCVGDGVGGSNPGTDIDFELVTSEGFEENVATLEKPEIGVEAPSEGSDEEIYVSFLVDVQADECIDLSKDVTVYDEDGIVIDEYATREQYDPGDTYEENYSIPHDPADVEEIVFEFDTNPLSALCHI